MGYTNKYRKYVEQLNTNDMSTTIEESRSGWKATKPGEPIVMPSSVSNSERNIMAATILGSFKNLNDTLTSYFESIKHAVGITDALIAELDRTKKP